MSSVTPELQFERAESSEDGTPAPTVACVACETSLTTYFEVNGRIACERCRDALAAARRAPHAGPMLRATGLGLFAAIAGSLIYYGVAELTGYELGLISIVVGLLVGVAVRKGSRMRGGWRYQALAMFLTYAAIASTYVPRVLEALQEQRVQSVAPTQTATAPTSSAAAGQAPSERAASAGTAPGGGSGSTGVSGVELLGAVGLLIVFTLALPFLAGIDNIMGLVLIAIGLYEAWKVNKAPPFNVSGPYLVGAKTPST